MFCPNCRNEYEEYIKVCPDCDIDLVSDLNDNVPQEIQCENCGNQIQTTDEFCPFCGIAYTEDYFCHYHPEKTASSECTICKKNLCNEDEIINDNYHFCNEHQNFIIKDSNIVLYTSNDSMELEIIKNYLLDNNVETYIDDKGGDIKPYNISLFKNLLLLVAPNQVLKATKLLKGRIEICQKK